MPAWLKSERLTRLFFQRRLKRGNVAPKSWRARFHQFWFERGRSLPWILSDRECQEFWQVEPGQNDGVANRPEDYARGPVTIMRYVLEQIDPWVNRTDSTLEVGCNAGSKLNELMRFGFTNLSGIDINPDSLSVLKDAFPHLHESARLHAGHVEEVLSRLGDHEFAFIYSISSLQHIHPARDAAFDQIARTCGEFLLTCEIEWAGGPYYFPRNYRRVFERRGFHQMASVLITPDRCHEPELEAYCGHVMRLLRRSSSPRRRAR
jgi:SAM-dependent methyltransferase